MTYVVAQTGDDNDSDGGSVNEAVVAGVIAGVVVVLALVVLGIFRDSFLAICKPEIPLPCQ